MSALSFFFPDRVWLLIFCALVFCGPPFFSFDRRIGLRAAGSLRGEGREDREDVLSCNFATSGLPSSERPVALILLSACGSAAPLVVSPRFSGSGNLPLPLVGIDIDIYGSFHE